MIPHLCPVCLGHGNVPGGFYNSVRGAGSTSANTSEICRACGGVGVIYSSEVHQEDYLAPYKFGDAEDKISVLKDIRSHLLTIIEELQKIGRNV